MAIAGGYGLELTLQKMPRKTVERNDFALFSESNSRFLVEVTEKAKEEFEDLMKGTTHAELGKVTRNQRLCIYGLSGQPVVDSSLNELLACWKKALDGARS
jgi:phosphoribosylformylglycinamidine synthase